jgi:predicted nucleic acid-binding protein
VRVFLDANILFSAARSAGAIRALLEALLAAGHLGVTSDYALVEAQRNIAAKCGEPELAQLDALAGRLKVVGSGATQRSTKVASALAEKDRPILAAAIGGRCDALLTGDRRHVGPHFGKTLAGVAIHSPASLAEALWPAR